jgi:hypothetical protein
MSAQPAVISLAACRANDKAIPSLGIGAGKLGKVAQLVHLACGIDRQSANAAETETAYRELIGAALIQSSASATRATNLRHLNLVHVHGPSGVSSATASGPTFTEEEQAFPSARALMASSVTNSSVRALTQAEGNSPRGTPIVTAAPQAEVGADSGANQPSPLWLS